MKIFKNEINGVNFTIVCEVWQTKNAWGHVAKLLENDVEIGFINYLLLVCLLSKITGL